MKKITLSLAFIALLAVVVPGAEAGTRVSVGFNYGGPVYCYHPAYSYPIVARNYPRYRYKRFYRPCYSSVYFSHRPRTRIVVRSCY